MAGNQIQVAQWSVIHEVLVRVWKTLNGEATMPPTFPQEVVDALDDNLKIIYFDLLRLYDMISDKVAGPQGTLFHALTSHNQTIDNLRIADFIFNFTSQNLIFDGRTIVSGNIVKIISVEPFQFELVGNLRDFIDFDGGVFGDMRGVAIWGAFDNMISLIDAVGFDGKKGDLAFIAGELFELSEE